MTPTARRIALGTIALTTLVFLLAAVVPSVRAQLDLTIQREPESFVELAFAHPEAARACAVSTGKLTVHIQVTAHGQRAGTVPVSVEVVTDDTPSSETLTRQLVAQPNVPIEIIESVSVPESGSFTIVATVANGAERISVRCQP